MDYPKNEFQTLSKLDDEAVLAFSLHTPDAFEELVERYQSAFINKARSILRNEEDAYDVVQESFVRIYLAASRFKVQEGASFRSWAYKILINQCCTLYQKKKREYAHSAPINDDTIDSLTDEAEVGARDRKLSTDFLLSLVSKLPTMLARVVRLHFIESLPQKEVARIEGVSNGVIRARIFRAKKELRKIAAKVQNI